MRTAAIFALLGLSVAANLWLAGRFMPGGAGRRTSSTIKAKADIAPATRAGPAFAEVGLAQRLAILRALDMPPELIRAWAVEEVNAQFAARERVLRAKPRANYWQPEPRPTLQDALALVDLQAEKDQILVGLLGYDPNLPENAPYRFLPFEKQAEVKRVAETYAAKIDAYRSATSAMPTASEEASLARLIEERTQALAALLTPAEMMRLEMRVTLGRWKPLPPDSLGHSRYDPGMPIIAQVRRNLRHFDATETEFMAIAAVEEEFAPFRRFGGMDSGKLQSQVSTRIREALGPERYAEYRERSDEEAAEVRDLASRLELPEERVREVANLKFRVFAESTRVQQDASLDNDAKRTALSKFAAGERARIDGSLGPDGAAAFRRSADQWLRPLENGFMMIHEEERGIISRRPVGR